MSGRIDIKDECGCISIQIHNSIWMHHERHLILAFRQLQADLAAVSAERDRLRVVNGELRAQIGEYENAPVVAVVRADYTGDYIDRVSKMPPIGTELIARLKATP